MRPGDHRDFVGSSGARRESIVLLGGIRAVYQDIFSAVVRRRGCRQRTWHVFLLSARDGATARPVFCGERGLDGGATLAIFAAGR